MNTEAQERNGVSGPPSPRPSPPGEGETSAAVGFCPGSPVALAVVDEIFLRCAPGLTGSAERLTAAAVVDRNFADVLGVLAHLATALDSNSQVNTRTGALFTHVEPEWFERLRRVVERHGGQDAGIKGTAA